MKIFRTLIILALITSMLAQDNCPEAESILPCICLYNNEERPIIKCSDISSDDELEVVFSADFPVTFVYIFQLESSSLTEISRNVFGNVSFENVYLLSNNIELIDEEAFENSKANFSQLVIDDCPVSETTIPLNLETYVSLTDIELSNNMITDVPQINSTKLRYLTLSSNDLGAIREGAFTIMPQVNYFDLRGCDIYEIEDGVLQEVQTLNQLYLSDNNLDSLYPSLFRNLSSLEYLPLDYNQINYIAPGTFSDCHSLQFLGLNSNNLGRLNSSTFGEIPSLQTLVLSYNGIDYIQPGTFAGTPSLLFLFLEMNNLTTLFNGTFEGLTYSTLHLTDNYIEDIEADAFGNLIGQYISLKNNQLSELEESWLKPLLERNNSVHLEGNPITCGCDIAWIMEDDYQYKVYAQCPNGTDISDLDPDYFLENCF